MANISQDEFDRLSASAAGSANRQAGDQFEQQVAATFGAYAQAEVAWLALMPVPMFPTGQVHHKTGRMLFAPRGKAPFDVFGWGMDGVFIGVELKQTGARKTSLPIIAPGKHGSGLQFHQLDSLYMLALRAGTARVLWSNGGEWGLLCNAGIINAYHRYVDARKSELRRKQPKHGAKSILWEHFSTVENESDWLDLMS